jgi:hypothetical protein
MIGILLLHRYPPPHTGRHPYRHSMINLHGRSYLVSSVIRAKTSLDFSSTLRSIKKTVGLVLRFTSVRISSVRDLDSFPERGWPEPRWDPILTTPRSLNLARARYLFCARALLLLSLG